VKVEAAAMSFRYRGRALAVDCSLHHRLNLSSAAVNEQFDIRNEVGIIRSQK
jgi:hypothetical protein